MKKSNEILLKDAIEAFLKENHLDEKLRETRMISNWEKIAGKLIARHTLNIYLKNRILHIKVDSAALREELTFQRSKLVKKMNKVAGAELIDDISFA
jgi:predicted nucleic acid-binding Zn ribbon protein